MKLKIECVKKDLMDKLSKISNNVVVNNFIVELINSGRVTNFFCNENSYFFKGDDNYISICLNDCGVIVNSYIDGIDQVFQFDKCLNNLTVSSVTFWLFLDSAKIISL